MKSWLRITATIAAAGLLSFNDPGAFAANEWTGPKTTVKMGVSNRPDQAFLELGLANGFFDKQGIVVEKVPGAMGNDFVAPLALNQLQVASGSPNASLFNAMNRRIDIRVVADFAHLGNADDGLVSIVVRKELIDSGSVKTFADLKGRTISLGPGRGQYAYMLVNTILAKNQMNWSDLEIQNLGLPDIVVALGNKSIDAGFLIEPVISAAVQRDIAVPFIKGGEVEPGAHLALLFFSAQFAQQSDVATRFMVAYLQSARAYADAFVQKKDREAAIDILVKALPVKDPEVWRRAMPQNIDPNGKVNAEDIKRQAGVYKTLGDISGPVPETDRYIDQGFSEHAVQVLGAR